MARKSRPHALEDRERLSSGDPGFVLWQPGLPAQALREADGRLGSDAQESHHQGGMQGKEGRRKASLGLSGKMSAKMTASPKPELLIRGPSGWAGAQALLGPGSSLREAWPWHSQSSAPPTPLS